MKSMSDNGSNKCIVITSINPPNEVLKRYASLEDWTLILVGDRSGPKRVDDERIRFLDIDAQADFGLTYPHLCPENHYSRKNIGYLYAMFLGANTIAETDDDNMPKKNWGTRIGFGAQDLKVYSNVKYFNVYSCLTNEHIWPRGFPLDRLRDPLQPKATIQNRCVGVWQHLVDNHPDVDAIYRLANNCPVVFKPFDNFALAEHVYCPFNSQNTFWSREAFPLMYLPKSVTFRFTDILRGYIAQRLLWEEDMLLGFGKASVRQNRNSHDLFNDFLEEIPMYQRVGQIVNRLESLTLRGTLSDGLFIIYETLAREHIVDKSELMALEAWVKDLETIEAEIGQFH